MRRQQVTNGSGLYTVVPPRTSVADYAAVVGGDMIAEIEQLARPLQGARIMHVSATAHGGGVAEMLQTLIPLMNDVGLDAQWRVIGDHHGFFNVTNAMHNALQGMDLDLTPEMRGVYLHTNVDLAAHLDDEFDYVIVHDLQPAPLRALCRGARGKWIWRCHIDLTAANPTYWSFLRPFVQVYDAAIFTSPTYVKHDLHIGKVAIAPPGIDPLSPKNRPMGAYEASDIIRRYGVDPERPMLTQVSRFDPWKDPLGVIDVYRNVKHEYPALQLILIGPMAHDDPEGVEYYMRTQEYANNDPDIHVLSSLDGVGSIEVNAFQRQATIILQKSLREGFGLSVSEGLWKAKPVIGGNAGGIPLQIRDGVNGYLVGNIDMCTERVLELLSSPERAQSCGEHGQETVRRNFLAPADLRNYLKLFGEMTQERAVPSRRKSSTARSETSSLAVWSSVQD